MKTTLSTTFNQQDYSSCYGSRMLRMELDEAIELLPACVAGCLRAQNRFYKIFQKPMLQFCLRYTKGNLDKANDIAQEAFAKAFLNLSAIKSPPALHVWMTKVFFSEAMDFLRITKTLKHSPNQFCAEVSEEMIIEVNDSEFEYQHDLDVILLLLTKRYRGIFLMTANGYSYEDISIECRMPTGTVKSIVSRERAKIRKVYEERHWLCV